MGLIQDAPLLAARFKELQPTLAHNHELFRIHEGDLKTYVLAALKEQLSDNAYKIARHRIAPINVLKRLIDKLSKIYAQGPSRAIADGSDADSEILKFYTDNLKLNTTLTEANRFFNLFKTTALEPYLDHESKPRLRTIPSDRFFIYSNDSTNPMRVTHFVKIMGERNVNGRKSIVFYGYTDTEFLIFDDKGDVVTEMMQSLEGAAAGGINPIGRIPFVYISRSKHNLTPVIDTDTLQMTKLLPVLLSDLNYAVMFQCFSILYGIDLDDQDIVFAPNKFLKFKTDATSPNSKPMLGTLKPEVDSDKVLDLVRAELSMWLQSKNIKPGAMGSMSSDNMASGVAKVIDEMDTSEDRQEQVGFFKDAEQDLFDLIRVMHTYWVREPGFGSSGMISPKARLIIEFSEQRAIVDTSKVIDDEIKKMGAGLESRRGSLRNLNPDWSDEQIDEKIAEIDSGNEHAESSVADKENTPDQNGSKPDAKPANGGSEIDKASGVAIAPRQALNGAQVTSLIDVVGSVSDGRLPRATGVYIIQAAFNLPKEEAEKIMGDVGRGFKPEPPVAPMHAPKANA